MGTILSDRFDLLTEDQVATVEAEIDFSLPERIRAVVTVLGMDESVRVSGKSEKQLRRYMAGDDPPFSVLQKLSDKSDTSLDWLSQGERKTKGDADIERDMLLAANAYRRKMLKGSIEPMKTMLEYGITITESLLETISDEHHSTDLSDRPTSTPLPVKIHQDFIALPFLDIHASAGHGAVAPIHEEVRTVISFERAFLRNLGALPDLCRIIGARGDSMAPTIPDGALIVVDHSQTDVVNGWISVVNVGGDLLVKRVRRRLDGTVELVSDNPLYPVETIGSDRIDQLTIIGRVVYFCRAP